MEPSLTFNQHRFLKQIADAGGEVPLSKLKPATKPVDRNPLVQLGLVVQSKQKRSVVVALTQHGREWLSLHPVPTKQTKPKPVKPPRAEFPTDAQRVFLIKLAFMPQDSPATGLAGLLKPNPRAELEELVRSTKQGRSAAFELTDAGWNWVAEHYHEPILGGAAQSALTQVLGRVHAFLHANGMRLSDFLRAKPVAKTLEHPTPAEDSHKPAQDLPNAIRSACLELANGHTKRRVRLADLRAALPGWEREQVDQALLDLSLSDPVNIVLGFIDDPTDTRPEDREAQFTTPSGKVRNILEWVGN
jgi:predicted transcriptional regulator